jgi:hypothetical protein
MASKPRKSRRRGLPPASAVLREMVLVPGAAALAAAAGTRAALRTYRVLRTNEVDPKDRKLNKIQTTALRAGFVRAPGDAFEGTARRAAKLSISSAKVETFGDVQDLIDTLPSHTAMKNRKPKISKDKTSKRVKEEQRNVRLRAFIYAASREDDNDFHLIVGHDPDLQHPVYMTMELSGLPATSSSHHAKLKAVRDTYKDFFGSSIQDTTYDFYDPPIPIEVEGSLFWDASHATGSRPGPSTLRPDMPVVWEVHPISKIVFEP